jgi:hypothetical protein
VGAARSARLEVRLTVAQKELIEHGAAIRGKTITEYAVEVLTRAAQRDATADRSAHPSLGWMRGTAVMVDDISGPSDPDGWEPREPPG